MAWVKGMSPKMIHDNFGVYDGDWMPEMDRSWLDYDRGYSVCSRMINTKQFGNVEHVTITRIHKDGDPLIAMHGEMAIGWNETMLMTDLCDKRTKAYDDYKRYDALISKIEGNVL